MWQLQKWNMVSVISLCAICIWTTVDGHKIHHLPDSRIVGGKPVHPQIIPYYVHVGVNLLGLHGTCGGSLISDRHILTAAHCITMLWITGKIEKLQFGPHKKDNEEEESFSFETSEASFVIHPQHVSEAHEHDLAIITLPTPLNMSLPYVGLAKLPEGEDANRNYAGETLQVYGMGRTSDNREEPGSKELMWANLTGIDYDTCYALMKRSLDDPKLYDYEICTNGLDSSQKPVSACHGDSGGPLVYRGTVVGVASRLVVGYCAQGEPTVYVGVAQHLQWIKEVISTS